MKIYNGLFIKHKNNKDICYYVFSTNTELIKDSSVLVTIPYNIAYKKHFCMNTQGIDIVINNETIDNWLYCTNDKPILSECIWKGLGEL